MKEVLKVLVDLVECVYIPLKQQVAVVLQDAQVDIIKLDTMETVVDAAKLILVDGVELVAHKIDNADTVGKMSQRLVEQVGLVELEVQEEDIIINQDL